MTESADDAGVARIDILWIPLGAGAHAARVSGRIFEGAAAALGGRPRCDLYHSALQVHTREGVYVVEQTPVPAAGDPDQRGVVATGAVGLRWARGLRVFRYEVRRWLGGVIPDAGDAVGGPRPISDNVAEVSRVLHVVARVPTPVWGRDELDTGEMWNSNSVIAWTLRCGGVDLSDVRPPVGGRAPGWRAGLVIAARQGGAVT